MTSVLTPRPWLQSSDGIAPQIFATNTPLEDAYLADAAIRKLVEFFEAKGLAAIKDEDQREQWYEDWLAYQSAHGLYASLLSPKRYSKNGSEFDLARLTRFLEVFGFFSPAHGYSLQVSFLGLFSILMGSNDALKEEAIAALERGGLFAFGVSEKEHGSDLLGNGFRVREIGAGRLVANGSKYYIGNANCASMIAILGRQESDRDRGRRAAMLLFAIRPGQSPGFGNVRKIRTHGVRAAFVGAFDVKDHELPAGDIIARGREAWEAVFGTVSLGKFFLGFGSIGICEHAFSEAAGYLSRRVLFGKPVIEMPHIRATMAQAYTRLRMMKLYAYRALDYVRAAQADDRRYLLFTAVQKAKVSTEGVKVMALLSECIGARGFENDTYFEMALRDAQLIPGLEGSTHINLGLATQFMPAYFAKKAAEIAEPESAAGENPYLFAARTGAVNTIAFPHFLNAYRPLMTVPNVRIFVRQAKAFSLLERRVRSTQAVLTDGEMSVLMGQCMATIAYGQLIGENVVRHAIAPEDIATIFHVLVYELSLAAMALLASPRMGCVSDRLRGRLITVPRTSAAEWEAAGKLAVAMRE